MEFRLTITVPANKVASLLQAVGKCSVEIEPVTNGVLAGPLDFIVLGPKLARKGSQLDRVTQILMRAEKELGVGMVTRAHLGDLVRADTKISEGSKASIVTSMLRDKYLERKEASPV